MVNRKQLDICGLHVPALNNVGEACVNHFSDIKRYVSQAALISFWWMPIATRISMCWGRSATFPSIFSRYDLIKVCKYMYVGTCKLYDMITWWVKLEVTTFLPLHLYRYSAVLYRHTRLCSSICTMICYIRLKTYAVINYTYLKTKVVVVIITGIYNFRVKNLKRKKKRYFD